MTSMCARSLISLLVDLSEYFRFKFKASSSRSVVKIGDYVIKMYENADECVYEYEVLTKIVLSDPITFRVPKAFKLFKTQSYNALIMEYVIGRYLDNYILNFLLRSNLEAIRIFYLLGKAVRELHSLGLDGLHSSSLPSSRPKLKNEIVELSKKLVTLKIFDDKLFNIILVTVKKANLTDEIFLNANLHGELYFTHVLVQDSDSKIILLDFHNAQRGPAYFDLAMLSTSLYVSLALPSYTLRQLEPLIDAFLTGYYGKGLNAEVVRSMKLAELYVVLREILMYAGALNIEDSLVTSFLATLRIKRLKAAIKEVILPKLIA